MKKGPWTPEEDQKLVAYIQEHGHGSWRELPEKAGLARCGKSCRLRWTNYLRPDIKRGRFSHEEDQKIIQLHAILGNRWSAIAGHLPQRTDNEIKNYWNTHLKKRLAQMGIDPITHKTSSSGLALTSSWRPIVSTQLTHMTQWDCALAEAEARLSKKSSMKPFIRFPEAAQSSAHPSTYFMRSWKTGIEDKHRPKFGIVKRESSPVRIDCPSLVPNPARRPSNLLQNWDTILGLRTDQPGSLWQQPGAWSMSHTLKQIATSGRSHHLDESAASQARSSTIDMSGEVASMADDMMFPQIDRTGSNLLFVFESAGATRSDSVDRYGTTTPGDYFSPTSTLHGPDPDFTHSESGSPCGSSTDGSTLDCFDFTVQPEGSFHSFSLLPNGDGDGDDGDARLQESSLYDIPDTFWQAGQETEALQLQTVEISDDGGPDSGGLDLIIPLDFSNAEFSQHLESLCQEPSEYQTDIGEVL